MKVSVILPFFNARNTLRAAAMSILNQTYQNLELILVDNNSVDGSSGVAQELTAEDQRVKLVMEKRQGVVFASETAFQFSTGEFISRMDADDFAHPDKLIKQVAFFNNNPQVGVVACLVKHHESCQIDGRGISYFVSWSNALQSATDIYLNRFIESPIINPSVLIKREVIEKYGFYREGDFPEDYELWLRWMRGGVRFGKVPEQLFTWNDSPARVTRNDQRYDVEAFYEIKTHYLAHWLKKKGIRKVWIWGNGRLAKKRAALLNLHQIYIEKRIDVNTDPNGSVMDYNRIENPDGKFILSYVGNRGARAKIREFLVGKGFVEGIHFLCMS